MLKGSQTMMIVGHGPSTCLTLRFVYYNSSTTHRVTTSMMLRIVISFIDLTLSQAARMFRMLDEVVVIRPKNEIGISFEISEAKQTFFTSRRVSGSLL